MILANFTSVKITKVLQFKPSGQILKTIIRIQIKEGQTIKIHPSLFSPLVKLTFQRSHINDKAVFHVGLQKSLESIVDLLHVDDLDF